MTIINSVIKGGGSSGPAYYIEKTKDANGVLQKGTSFIDLSGVSDLGNLALYYAFYGVSFSNSSIDFSPITTVRGSSACSSCFTSSNITSLNADTIKTITGEGAFQNAYSACSSLTSASVNGLEIINAPNVFNGTFSSCTNLSSLFFDLLTYQFHTSGGNFQNFCSNDTSLTNVCFYSLKMLYGNNDMYRAFRGATNLATLSFPALTTSSFGSGSNQFNQMCTSVSNVTLHFPSNVQSTIEGLVGYSTTAPFGATAGTVLFDLPATNLLTGLDTVVYERNPKYDTATALAWRVQDTGTAPNITIDWTPFYTSGLTDPTVGTTIYSDDACTVAVTTVDSIA